MIITERQVKGYLSTKGLSDFYAGLIFSLTKGRLSKDNVHTRPYNMGGGDIVEMKNKKVLKKEGDFLILEKEVLKEIAEHCPVCGCKEHTSANLGLIGMLICEGCGIPRKVPLILQK